MPSEFAILNPIQARNAFALIAEGEVGVRESGGNNRGPRIVAYQQATWLEPDAWPWCAAFVCWCVREWLSAPSVRKTLGMTLAESEKWRPKTAGAWDFLHWARSKHLTVNSETGTARRGDIVVFEFSHIGIVVRDSSSGALDTVEGNTNGRGDRDSAFGDGVWRKRRARSLARAFIRLV